MYGWIILGLQHSSRQTALHSDGKRGPAVCHASGRVWSGALWRNCRPQS